MTSRERLLKAIKGEVPDRVPVTLFILEQGHYIHQLYPDIDPFDFEQLMFKNIDYQRSIGCDVFARMLFDLYDPIGVYLGGLDDGQETGTWKVKTEEHQDGDTMIRNSTITTPEGILTQTLTRVAQNRGTFVYNCTKKPITSEAELDLAIKYEPPPREGYAEMVKEKIGRVKDYLGDDGVLGVWGAGAPFNNASMIIDHKDLYMLFLTDPGFYDKLMKFTLKRISAYTKAFIDGGTDVMCIGGNVPGGFMGADVYDQYILPYEKEHVDFIQEQGCPAMYHNCGEIMELVGSYKKLGAVNVEPFSPHPLGDARLDEAVKKIEGAYSIIGGVDQVNVIQKGTKEMIKAQTLKVMEAGKKNGAFIIQSADFLEYNTNPEHVEYFVKTALEHAAYE